MKESVFRDADKIEESVCNFRSEEIQRDVNFNKI
jgi:hypothetical protein